METIQYSYMGKDNDKKMMIFHICSWYPNRVVENDGNFIHKHIRATLPYVKSYVLAVYEDDNLIKKSYEIKWDNVDGVESIIVYHSKSTYKLYKIIRRFYFYTKGYLLLRKKHGKPDLFHAHVFLFGGIFASILSLFTKIPFIISEHSNIFSDLNISPLKLKLIKFAAQKSKVILPVSKNLQNKIERFKINGNFKVLPNVVDTNIFNIKNSINSKKNFHFIHISNFADVKNIPGLINSIEKLLKIRSDFIFTIAGDGDLNYVNNLVANSHINKENIKILGKQTENKVAGLMQQNDVFVLFSNDENLPCVVLEALCCGLPVISTNVGGIKEVVIDQIEGFLINIGDENDLVSKMNFLIDNYQFFDINKISEKAVSQYSAYIIGSSLNEIYKNSLMAT